MTVELRTVTTIPFAAVRAHCRLGEISRSFKAPLDQVWAYLRAHPALKRGHNVFLYHHVADAARDGLDVDFGVEVDPAFTGADGVTRAETPAGEAAVAVHRGPYGEMHVTHAAIHAWCREHGRTIGAASWEVYGDWTDDPAQLETTIYYLLA